MTRDTAPSAPITAAWSTVCRPAPTPSLDEDSVNTTAHVRIGRCSCCPHAPGRPVVDLTHKRIKRRPDCEVVDGVDDEVADDDGGLGQDSCMLRLPRTSNGNSTACVRRHRIQPADRGLPRRSRPHHLKFLHGLLHLRRRLASRLARSGNPIVLAERCALMRPGWFRILGGTRNFGQLNR